MTSSSPLTILHQILSCWWWWCSVTKPRLTPREPTDCSMPPSLSSTVSQSVLKFISIESVMLSNHLISVVPFSSCLQSIPASGSFPMSWHFASGGRSIGASASASIFPMDIHVWFPLGLIALISLQSKGLSRVFSSTTVRKHQFFSTQPSLWSKSHIYTWLWEKPQLWLYGPLSAKWCLCFFIMHHLVL